MDWWQRVFEALGDKYAWLVVAGTLRAAAVSELLQFSIIAVPVWLALHVVLKTRLQHRLIRQWPSGAETRRDVVYTFSSFVIFAMLNVVVLGMEVSHLAEIYTVPTKHGLAWLVVSLPLLIIWQDAYFYWTHRGLHTRWLFKRIHHVHHHSRDPSPWTGYAFHPLEALNYSVMLLIPIALLPLNETVVAIFLIHQIIRNTLGHAAVETMPSGFARSRLWGQFTTTTHHHMHHEAGRGNYGLWFTWWDRVCGTECQDYLFRFERATGNGRLTRPAGQGRTERVVT